eukprot:CAMPEP_0198143136 /NCGR_PEP_ID=MMETSP1443-20131203/5863_1 /TAXON_ID=186043 /ORGANISM="Entomoneis sp., Strain CCMP2396" /LENGTH=299 /DNA_ID=CAMNT_0043806301 /DNA_START=46 /DNA_END=945 /DNA_ORIENTATION=+
MIGQRLLVGRRSSFAVSRFCVSRFSTASSSSSDELVATHVDDSTNIATLTMQHGPVNSLSLEMLQALSTSIKTVEANPSVKALILQSSNKTIFSAGLDITEMHNPEMDRLKEFWNSFQQLYLDLYGSRLPCVASLQGTAPAAGCMLALSCDYRILVANPKAKIGLNETQLGIVPPAWLSRQMVDTIGHRKAEISMGLGTLYSPEQALEIGLVDEIIDGEDDAREKVAERSMEMALAFGKILPHAWYANKRQIRGQAIAEMKQNRQQDLDNFVHFVTREQTQKNLTAYLQALAKKKAPKK